MSLTEHRKINGILYIITRIINKAEITAIPVKQFIYKNKSSLLLISQFRPNITKNKCVSGKAGLKILSRVGLAHMFFFVYFFFFWKKNNFMHFERHFAFQNA